MCQRIVDDDDNFNDLIKLFMQKIILFFSTYVLTFCFGFSLLPKDCFKYRGLFIRRVLGRLMHYTVGNTH